MNSETVQRLLQINREFYTQFAHSFAQSRSAARVNLELIMPYVGDGVKVLDVGCGNGRLAKRLDDEHFGLHYVGVDASPQLIALARAVTLKRVSATLCLADVTAPKWTTALREHAPFDLTLAFAVLHHIPSFDLRCRVLRDIHGLLRADGVLVMSNWQFTHSERLKNKVVSFRTLDIDERELEAGDALLDWKRDGAGVRYVHLLTRDEVQSLAAQSGFAVFEQFEADGDLNLFSVLQRT